MVGGERKGIIVHTSASSPAITGAFRPSPSGDRSGINPATMLAGTTRQRTDTDRGGRLSVTSGTPSQAGTLPHSHANPEQDAQARAMHAAMVGEAQTLLVEQADVYGLAGELSLATIQAWISRASWVLQQVTTGG